MNEISEIRFNFKNVSHVIADSKPSDSLLCVAPRNLRSNVKRFITDFPGTVAWAVKSNPDPLFVRTINHSGIGDFDVASLPEVEMIKNLCPNGRLHFNHPVKAPEAIQAAYYVHDVVNFMVDHPDEIRKIASLIDNPERVTLLIRYYDPAVIPASGYNFGKKFGADPSQAIELLLLANELKFQVGLAFHPGTQYQKTSIYKHLLETGEAITCQARQTSEFTLTRVNVGGGFPAFYPDEDLPPLHDYFSIVSSSISIAQKRTFGPACEFICEPGRALVADTASLIARVELKRDDGRIYINNGFYGALMEQQFVDFSFPARSYRADGTYLTAAAEDQQSYTVFGPTCDSLDVIRQKVRLPKSLTMGDYIEFGFLGAYSNASATSFNGFKPARLVTVDEIEDWSGCSRPVKASISKSKLTRPEFL